MRIGIAGVTGRVGRLLVEEVKAELEVKTAEEADPSEEDESNDPIETF